MKQNTKFIFCGVLIVLLAVTLTGCLEENGADTYQITVSDDLEGGSIELTPEKDEYEAEETVKITAVPASQYWEFVEWGGDLEGEVNPYEDFIVEADSYITAEFTSSFPAGFKVEIQGEGDIEFSPEEFSAGDEITVMAEPKEGWEFKEWQGSISGEEPVKDIVVEEGMEIEAVFIDEYLYEGENIQFNYPLFMEVADEEEKGRTIITVTDPETFFSIYLEISELDEGVSEEDFMEETEKEIEMSRILIELDEDGIQELSKEEKREILVFVFYMDLPEATYQEAEEELDSYLDEQNMTKEELLLDIVGGEEDEELLDFDINDVEIDGVEGLELEARLQDLEFQEILKIKDYVWASNNHSFVISIEGEENIYEQYIDVFEEIVVSIELD